MQRGTKTVIVMIVAATVFAAGTLYVTLRLQESASRQLVLVRATVDVTTDAPPTAAIPADFGPDCAPARFLPSGALEINSDTLPPDAMGVVYLEYRPIGPFATKSAGIALLFFRSGNNAADIVSSVDRLRVLFRIHHGVNSTLVGIDGHAYYFGDPFFLKTFATPVTVGQSTWTVEESFSGVVVGPVEVRIVAPRPCA